MSTRSPARQPSPPGGPARWASGPREPLLAAAAVDVWRVDLTTVGDDLVDSLSAAERERALAILGEDARRLWSRSRGMLRELLGRYLRERAGGIVLSMGPNGKPRLAGSAGRALAFNLSHSRQLAVYAFTAVGSVGVDVEVIRKEDSRALGGHVALAGRVFGEQHARRLKELQPEAREREFLRLWTRHEAELKRRGVGLGAANVGRRAAADVHVEPSIFELDIGPAAVAALAVDRPPAAGLRLWEWP